MRLRYCFLLFTYYNKMPMKSLLLLLVPVLLYTSSCHRNRDAAVDKMTCYLGYGFRASNDIVMYQVDRAYLLKDDSAKFDRSYVFHTTQVMSSAKFALAKDLLDHVPVELLSGSGKTFGSPGSHDQGGYVIILEKDGVSKRYDIDQDDSDDQSKNIVEFKQKVANVMNQLR